MEAVVDEAGDERCQEPDLLTAAIVHGHMLRRIPQKLCRPAGPVSSFAIEKLWQGQLNLLLGMSSVQASLGGGLEGQGLTGGRKLTMEGAQSFCR